MVRGVRNMRFTRRHILAGLGGAPLLAPSSLLANSFDADAVVTVLADATRRLYHDEKAANRIADRLQADRRQGAFRNAASAGQLAGQLNKRISTVSGDIHFMVMASAMGHAAVPPTPPHSPTPPLSSSELAYLSAARFGIARSEILSGNIGRLDIRQFYRPASEVRSAVAVAMREVAETAALIVDLSRNPGGDPKAVAHFLSYFFERPPFVVNRFHWRNLPVEEFRTEHQLAGPNYGEQRPLVVQVSSMSFSAAEEFAYDVQALKRGVVVGQVTGGGANHALAVDLPGGMQAYIPQARAENPITKSNWEGVGVRPDRIAEPQVAAQAAHDLALSIIG